MVRQDAHAAEEGVSLKLVRLHPVALRQEDGAIGNRTGFVAPALARGEVRCNRVHAAKTHGEEHEGGYGTGAHALEQAEEDDDDKDQDDDGVFRSGQAFAASHQPLIQHPETGEDQHGANIRGRHQFQHAVAK